MNDLKIYEQVASSPWIRASELAVKLDLTLATVSADLRSLVDAGDLVKRTEFGEQGRQCQVYDLSDEFKLSRTYKAMIETMGQDLPVAVVAPTPTNADQVLKPAPTAAPAQQHGPSMTKVQLGMACIVKLGSATDDQMRDAMGLPAKTRVQAYMAAQMRKGTVVREGDRWKLGAEKVKPLDSVEKVGNIIVATKDASPIPRAVVQAIAAAPATPSSEQYRCAHWSDGTIELRSNGELAALLSEQELDFINGFMDKRRAT